MSDPKPVVLRLVLGSLQTNCYLVICPETHSAMVIDPADHPDRILAAAQGESVRIEQILLTHGHRDHLAALPALRDATGARVLVHRQDVAMMRQPAMFYGLDPQQLPKLIPDIEIEGGESLSIGNLKAAVIHTPGHTPGGITLQVGRILFTGDTLFAAGVGRVDLPGGDWGQILGSLRQLFSLPEDCSVQPGHGPSTTIAVEKTSNPYLQYL